MIVDTVRYCTPVVELPTFKVSPTPRPNATKSAEAVPELAPLAIDISAPKSFSYSSAVLHTDTFKLFPSDPGYFATK